VFYDPDNREVYLPVYLSVDASHVPGQKLKPRPKSAH
jgi:hypothetical protein